MKNTYVIEDKQLPCNKIFELHWLLDSHLSLPGRVVCCIQLQTLGHCPVTQGFTAAANRHQLLGACLCLPYKGRLLTNQFK